MSAFGGKADIGPIKIGALESAPGLEVRSKVSRVTYPAPDEIAMRAFE